MGATLDAYSYQSREAARHRKEKIIMELKTRLAFARKRHEENGWFYPFARHYDKIVGLTTNERMAHSASIAHTYRTGMSGCSDEQMAVKIDSYPIEILLPQSWHYTMSGYLEGERYFIADIPEPDPEDWEETKLLRVHGMIPRAMTAVYSYLEPVEHGIIHRGQFAWENLLPHIEFKTLDGKCSVIPSPVSNRAYISIEGIVAGEFFVLSDREDQFYHFGHEKDGEPNIKLYHRKCAATGRQFWTGMASTRRGCEGFEEGQTNCRILGGEAFFCSWDEFREKYRLGDYIFGEESLIRRFPDIVPLSPAQVWASKLDYVGDDRRGILFHPDHGGIKINIDDHAFALQYEVRGHD